MADELNTPSGTETAVAEVSEQAGESKGFDFNHFIRGAFGIGPKASDKAANVEPTADGEASGSEAGDAASGKPTAQTPEQTAAAKAEDDRKAQEAYDRRVQSDVDKRLARKEAEERKAERARLRETNPIEYAREDEQREREQDVETERTQRYAQVTGSLANQFDTSMLGPIMEQLDEPTRAAAYKDIPADPLEARSHLVKFGLKAIETKAEKAAEAKLRKSPAFQKQVLAELRGEMGEPDVIEGVPAGLGAPDMNIIMRRAMGII